MIPNLYQANPNDSMGEQDSFYFQRCPQTGVSLSAIQRIGLVTHSFVLYCFCYREKMWHLDRLMGGFLFCRHWKDKRRYGKRI
jgi:hypothetical protein